MNCEGELNELLKAIEDNPANLEGITNLAIKLLEKLTHTNRFTELTPAIGLLIRIVGANKPSGAGILPFSLNDIMKNCSGVVGFANIDALFALVSGMSKNPDAILDVLHSLFKENVQENATQCLVTVAKVIVYASVLL